MAKKIPFAVAWPFDILNKSVIFKSRILSNNSSILFGLVIMLHSPEHIIEFGINEGLSLKEIYQYKPTYLNYLIEFGRDFEIDVKDFENLPHPTIADPDQISLTEGGSKVFYPPIKLETSVRIIREYIGNGDKSKQTKFNFSNKSVEILKLRSIGQYVSPKYIKRPRLKVEDFDKL